MLAVHSPTISQISVHSNKKQLQKRSISPSTHNTQNPQANTKSNRHNATASENYWDQSSETRRLIDLKKQIESMEKQELEMEAKFQQCIESMLAQIERNNDNNARLASEVNSLKHYLTESRKDIFIIQEYMKANLKKEVKVRETNDALKTSKQPSIKNTLASCSSSKNLLLRRTPSKYFKSKLLQKQ